jgi:glycerol dehydrogenase-like iron-containing ADH family enzyme
MTFDQRCQAEGLTDSLAKMIALRAWQASRRAALEEAGAFMDKRADELDACGNHTASTMARIYRDEAASIRSLATGDKHEFPD